MQASKSQAVAYATDRGNVRERNEDAVAIYRVENRMLMAVADGIGGRNAGDMASHAAVKVSSERLRQFMIRDGGEVDGPAYRFQLISAFNEAQKELDFEANEARKAGSRRLDGMGTTLTVAVIDSKKNMLYIGHIGDSRAYVIENGGIAQITADHDRKAEGYSNVLTRMLYERGNDKPDILEPIRVQGGAFIVLCSDGLENCEVKPGDILQVVLKNGADVQKAADELVGLANSRGGRDNVTVAIARM